MSVHEATEQAPAPFRESPDQPRSGIGLNSPASVVLALQRSAGNAAVVRYLARCGSIPCDCSRRQRADDSIAHPALRAPTQLARIQHLCEACERGRDQGVHPEVAMGRVLARWPGDGMVPPGDCAWGTYLPLRLSVESAKAVVSTLGACAPTDSCTFLAAKIAAISAEIAARVALDTSCFRGGDTGHREQVQVKINMVNRCFRFFQTSNCPQGLLAAMEVVIASARAVVEAAAVAAAAAVIVAAVAALVAAIIALLDVIAAAAAAAAEAAAVAAAVAALTALLILIKDNLQPERPSTA